MIRTQPAKPNPEFNGDVFGRMPELLLLLVLSAALKVFAALNDVVVNSDAVIYLSAAREFAAGRLGEGLAVYPLPAYPLLIAAVNQIIPDGILAARALNITASVLTLIPLCLLTGHLFGRRAAFWTGIAFALCPQHNAMAIEVIRDPLFIFFMTWAAFYLVRGLSYRRRWCLLTGSACAWLAVLFRIEGLVLLGVYLGLLLMAACFWRDHRRLGLEGFCWGVLPAVMALVLLFTGLWPQVGAAHRLDEIWSRIQEVRSLAFLENYARIDEALRHAEAQAFKAGTEFFRSARHNIALIYFIGLLEDLATALFPMFIIPLLAGFKARVPRPMGWALLILAGTQLLTAYFDLIQMDQLSTRHLMPAAVLLFPWVGRGTEALVNWLLERRVGLVIAPLAVALLFAVPAFKTGAAPGNEDRAISRAGRWLKAHAQLQDARLATNDWRMYLYADRWEPYAAMRALAMAMDQHYQRAEFAALEAAALEQGKNLLALAGRHQSPDPGPVFQRFRKIGEIPDRRNVVRIYALPELAGEFKAGALKD
jgi:4-amino-4-deoxy-L-arabinose transferase-like glycosyltransferase